MLSTHMTPVKVTGCVMSTARNVRASKTLSRTSFTEKYTTGLRRGRHRCGAVGVVQGQTRRVPRLVKLAGKR